MDINKKISEVMSVLGKRSAEKQKTTRDYKLFSKQGNDAKRRKKEALLNSQY